MQQAQIVTYGIDGPVALRLRELAQERRFRLRETSQVSAFHNLVQSTAPPIAVLVVGRDLERELTLLEQIRATLPATAVIVVGETDNPTLAGLAWDLGATFVLFPPTAPEAIGDVVVRLLEVASE